MPFLPTPLFRISGSQCRKYSFPFQPALAFLFALSLLTSSQAFAATRDQQPRTIAIILVE